jgi:hypothetical protein
MPFICRRATGRLEFLCAAGLLCRRRRASMLDVLFFGGGLVLFCLLIAYERLCHRI